MTEQYQKLMPLLVSKGISQKKIVELAGVSQAAVSQVIHGKARIYRVEKIITELTGYQFPPFKQVPRTLSATNS